MLTEARSLRPARHGLEEHGIRNINAAYWNLGAAQLLEQAIQRREGSLADGGSLVVRTGQFTGRSPKDKFIVRDETTDAHVHWGAVNQPMSEAHFDRLFHKMQSFWQVQGARFLPRGMASAGTRTTHEVFHVVFARQTSCRRAGEGIGQRL